jgi:hypothetical protein
VLGQLAAAEHGADPQADRVAAAQRTMRTLHGLLDPAQGGLGGVEQVEALAGALLGQRRVAADQEALAGRVGRGDLGHFAGVEQR